MSHVTAEIILTNNKHPFLLFLKQMVVVSLGFFITFCRLWTGLFQNKRDVCVLDIFPLLPFYPSEGKDFSTQA